ncbi:MAG: DUF5103 domain-containing protein [Bacteroidales bacterium]|jgi:hypothetical protein|nr:DUF5103 domain-containing protein [Bacteroidales bacterium]
MRLFRCSFPLIGAWVCCIAVQAQYEPPGDVYPDDVMADNVKTVRLYREGWEISYPVRNVNDEQPMVLTFDELDNSVKTYAYRIIHCDADWRRSRLVEADYLEGFPVNYIRHYDYSFNTVIPYVHYLIPLPNEDISFKLSGNYAIVVYEDGNEEYPILCKRFSITESIVAVQASAIRPRLTSRQDEWQQVELLIRTTDYPVENPYQDVKIVILKNGQWHSAIKDIKPLFVRQNELDYRQEKAGLFPAGNEYRPLDLKSIRYSSTPVSKIDFGPTTYHFYLRPDEPRKRYLFREDFNGRYAIQSEKTDQPDIACEYVYAHFTLKTQQPFDDGQMYVCGAFCNNACTPANRMDYNEDMGQYEASILLKQGYYNYRYVFLPFATQIPDETLIEGSFSDTENDYLVYVYHRGRLSRYDRLIGVTTVNSLHQNR